MREFRLVPDDPPHEKARKRCAMLRRIEQEKESHRNAQVGLGPQLPPRDPQEIADAWVAKRRERREQYERKLREGKL
jgi:hypothetical protein